MAGVGDRIKGITIEINGDTTNLKQALSGVNGDLKDTKDKLKDVEKLLKMDPGNLDLLKQKQGYLKDAVQETKEKLDKLKEAYGQMNEIKAFTPEQEEQYNSLQREIAETESNLKDLEKQAKDSNAYMEKIASVGKSFQSTGQKIESAGTSLLPVTAGIVGLGTTAVKTTMDFDTEMSKVAAISGATGEDIDALREKAKEMGATTKFSASEAAEALEYMAMAGWKTDAMLDGISGIMNLAAASGEELGTTSDIVTDALTAFGMSAADSGHFADVLAAASSNANTNVSMLGESFKYVAPVAGAMGYTAEDTSLALGLMANAGIKASQGGTALRATLTNLAKPSEAVSNAMDYLGISLSDDESNMYSLREVMDQLRSAFGDVMQPTAEFDASMDALTAQLENGEISEKEYNKRTDELIQMTFGAEQAEKARLAATIAGRTGMSGLLAIVNASEEDYQKLAGAIDTSSEAYVKTTDGAIIPMSEAMASGAEIMETYNGSAEAMAAIMQNNLGGRLTILKSSLEGLAISFGEILIPIVEKAVEAIQGLVNWFNGLDEGVKEIITQAALFVAALAPVLITVGKLSQLIGVMLQHPILSIIALIIGALVLLYQNCEPFRNFVNDLWNNYLVPFGQFLAEGFMEAWNGLTTFFSETLIPSVQLAIDIFSSLWKEYVAPLGAFIALGFKTAWTTISTFFGETVVPAVTGVIDIVSSLWKDYLAPVGAYLALGFKTAWTTISTFFGETVVPAVTGVIDIVSSLWKDYLAPVGAFISLGFKTAWNTISTFFGETVVPAVTGVIDIVSSLWKDYVAPLGAFVSLGFKTAWNTISTFFTGTVVKAITSVRDKAKYLWKEVLKPFGTFISKTFHTVWSTLSTFWNMGFSQTIGSLETKFSEFKDTYIKPVYEFIRDNVIVIFENLNTFWNDTLMPKITELGTLFLTFKTGYIEPVYTFLSETFGPVFETVKGLISGLGTWLHDTFTGTWTRAWETIVGKFDTIFSKISTIIKAPINGVIDLINKMIGAVEGALNFVIGGMNTISFTVPDWVPKIGGDTFGINIAPVNWGRIPRLAAGGNLWEGSAIVAEAGPELLTMQNGHARVTPLTGGSRTYNAGGVTMNIYAQPGQDVNELADLISERLDQVYRQQEAVFA